MLLPALKSIYH